MEKYHISFSYFPRNLSPSATNVGVLGYSQQSWDELLSFLAIRVGVAPVLLSAQQRILAYQVALRNMKKGAFYEKFFENEPLGTAKFLLAYRDELKWHFEDLALLRSTQRLKDFARLESSAAAWRGFPDLMQEIVAQLPHVGRLPITIQCEEPQELYPSYYQTFFQLLIEKGVEILDPSPLTPQAATGSNLHFVQSRLIGLYHKNETTVAPPETADGSLLLHHPANDLLAAAEISEWMKEESHFECLFLKENAYTAKALAATKQSLIKSKVNAYSQLAAQIFQSRISLLKNPAPLENVYDFLSLPLKPFNAILANHIIRGLQKNPSLESFEVQEQMEKAYVKITEKYDRETCNKAKSQFYEWFSPMIDEQANQISLNIINHKVIELELWANSYKFNLPKSQDGIYASLSELGGLCTEFYDLLNHETSDYMTFDQLTNLVVQWLGTKQQDVGFFTTSQYSWTNHFVGTHSTDKLIWLNFSKEWAGSFGSDKFQKIEYDEFDAITGKPWFKKKEADRLLLFAQIRKICSVKQQLKLSFTKNSGNQEQTPHLIWQLIQQELKSIYAAITWTPNQVDNQIVHKNWDGDTAWETPTFELQGLASLFPDRTSYSANKNLIYYPHIYLYERLLKLDASRNYTLEFKSQHFGTLLHLFVEIYASPGTNTYTRSAIWNNYSPQSWKALVDQHFDEFVKKQASFLFESKYAIQRKRLKRTLKFKLVNLFTELTGAGWELIDIEREINVPNFIQVITLTGKADMVWKNEANEYLIVDLKTGSKTDLKEELSENKAWQLMIYSHFGHPGNNIAESAYFMTNSGKFLLGSTLGLSNEDLVPQKGTALQLNPTQLLDHYKRAIAIRLDQIVRGTVDFRINAKYNKSLDDADDNPFNRLTDADSDFELETEPFKYDNFTFILPDAYRYV
jgi:RecB family exonuclease